MIKTDLYLGDCLEHIKQLPNATVDMVCTDPPYGMGFRSNYRQDRYDKIENDSTIDWLPLLAKEIFRVSKENTAHYVFCSFHNIDIFKQTFEKYFKVKNILVWEKNNTSMGDLKADFAPKIEFILFLQKGRRHIEGKRDPNIVRFARTGNKLHPTQKPVDLCEYLISKFSVVGDTVFDPFMGSGTTGVACTNINRNFIGVEMDVDYFKIAEQRIKGGNRGSVQCDSKDGSTSTK